MTNLYTAYLNAKQTVGESEHEKTVLVEHDGKTYRIITTKKRATRFSSIRCVNDSIVWEQMPVCAKLSGYSIGETQALWRLPVSLDKSCITVFVIRGKPNCIKGLDEGIFRSVHNFDSDCINVMSEARFREWATNT